MKAIVLRWLGKLFPVSPHEWPKALVLLSVATLLGMSFSMSRVASEGLFLTRLGIQYLPSLLLINPLLVLVASAIYGAFADRVPNDRLLIYTALIPVPLILLMRLLIALDATWVYFALYAFVLAYASILTTSWTVYISGHYDTQESKRLVPFISSGLLIGTVVGGMGVAIGVSYIGAGNVLLLWVGASLGIAWVVWWLAQRFTAMETESRKVKRGAKPPGMLQNLKEGVAFSRDSSLFLTTGVVSVATMVAIQLLDFEYSKILARAYPEPAALTAFLGIFDGLTTIAALLLQWCVAPWSIRRFGVQGANLLFPYVLTIAFGGLLIAPTLGTAMFARFTRSGLMPSLRGTTRTLMLNAVPRKMGARVRSFNTGVVLPVGQGLGALTLLALKGLAFPLLFPALGFLVSAFFVVFTSRQNKAYSEALLGLLQEDKIHLLDLEGSGMRQLDAAALATISERLRTDQADVSQTAADLSGEPGEFMQEIASAQEEVSLTAIELLRAIGSPHASATLQQHLPMSSPRLTAAALQAIAAIGGKDAGTVLQPYLHDPEPQVRVTALTGLRQLGDASLRQHLSPLLDDADVQVRAAALALVLADPTLPEYPRAQRDWETMLHAADTTTEIAALSIIPMLPQTPMQGRVYRALDRPAVEVRREALRILQQLAAAKRIRELDTALLRALEDENIEIRQGALQVLAAIGTDEALGHMLILLEDEQPLVRETLMRAVKPFGKRAIEPLLSCLRSPTTSLLAKESALLALARLEGVQADQLLSFWEGALRQVYQCKLMSLCLEASAPLEADTFLRVALQNEHDQLLRLLIQLLAVWESPEVARLVESGLHDPDRHKRAHALEALESLSERRFTRLFLPILEAEGARTSEWQDVATRQWGFAFTDVSEVIATCLQASDKWMVIGAILAGQARANTGDSAWEAQLHHVLASTVDEDIRNTVLRLRQGVHEADKRLSLTDMMLFLKRIPLYSSMTLEQLRTITEHLTERPITSGEVIFHQGDESYELYLIVAGKVEIVQERGGERHTIATSAAGDFFGEMAIFENRPRSATIVAVEEGLLLVLSPERFRHIILQEPAISFEIFRELSSRLRRLDQETLEVVC
jgi:HEAT repeat protein/ATP/ADP translocase